MTHFLRDHLLCRLAEVRERLGLDPYPADDTTRFADVLDSMGCVEFLALVADDWGVPLDAVENATGRRYSTIGGLVHDLTTAGLGWRRPEPSRAGTSSGRKGGLPLSLLATAVRLPTRVESADELNARLGRPRGWLESHAGIQSRHVWGDEDPLSAAVDAGRDALARVGLSTSDAGALLVTSEAPPQIVGTAATLHHRLGLSPSAVALEIGGACTGFLAALWTAQRLLPDLGVALIVAVEQPSRWLTGANAVLFGDATAACVVAATPLGRTALSVCPPLPRLRGRGVGGEGAELREQPPPSPQPLSPDYGGEGLRRQTLTFDDILLGTDGGAADLLRIASTDCGFAIAMDGPKLAGRAVRALAGATLQILQRSSMGVTDVAAVVAHGGNGRLPGLLARQLGLPEERVWSATWRTGNLGSASLPVAWSAHDGTVRGPVVWTAVGAGLQWGAGLGRCEATSGS